MQIYLVIVTVFLASLATAQLAQNYASKRGWNPQKWFWIGFVTNVFVIMVLANYNKRKNGVY